jgi:hypothetical protein
METGMGPVWPIGREFGLAVRLIVKQESGSRGRAETMDSATRWSAFTR